MKTLDGIEENFRFMALEVTKQVASARRMVENPDPERAKRLEARDDYIDNLKSVIENACWSRIHGTGPVGKRTTDLIRALNTVNINLERIADYAVNIAAQVRFITVPGFMRHYDYTAAFAEVERGLSTVTKALEDRDVGLALSICRAEINLDADFKVAFDRILTDLRRGESPESAITCFNIFRYLERMGDALLNIGEAIIFAAVGEKLKIHQYQALAGSLKQGGDLSGVSEFTSIWGTRSGCRIGKVEEKAGSPSKGVLFKEGNRDKITRERVNIERWQEISPGLTPRVQAYQNDGESASMLLEYLPGCTVQQVVLTADPEIVENAAFLVEQTAAGLWEQTQKPEKVCPGYMAQLASRLEDVFRLHPGFDTGERVIDGIAVPAFADLLAAAAAAETALAAPFSVFLHGDFNLNNIVYDHAAQRIHYVDLHRSRDGDYIQDVSVFLVSNFRLPLTEPKLRARPERMMRRFLAFARGFAREHGDGTFEARLALACARSFITSTRFEVREHFSREMFLRGVYLMEKVTAPQGQDAQAFAFPEAVLSY